MGTTDAHVVLVDDEADHRDTLLTLLEDGGFTVSAFDNAYDALQLLRSPAHVDLVLSDVRMPEMGGADFAQAARQIRPNVPVVLVTGRNSALDEILANGELALLKPYSIDTLNSVLMEHLGKALDFKKRDQPAP